ncbi:hypothetical protein ALC57_02930, partial [Trachymyrmex cornetzi]
ITTDVVETLGSIKARIFRVPVDGIFRGDSLVTCTNNKAYSGPYRIVEVLDHHNVRLRIRQATKSCI